MARSTRALAMAAAAALLALAGCDSPTSSDGPNLAVPAAIYASSRDGGIAVTWGTSTDEDLGFFDHYVISCRSLATGFDTTISLPKNTHAWTLRRLANGVRHSIRLHAVNTSGRRSSDSVAIEWSPAAPRSTDANGSTIALYPILSGRAAAIDLCNDSGRVEILDQTSAAFRSRGDLFCFTANLTTPLEIISASAYPDGGGRLTQFSTTVGDADSLGLIFLARPPDDATYTESSVFVTEGESGANVTYYGRTQAADGWHYFRMLVRRGADTRLIRDMGIDRHVVLEISYQRAPGVPYS